MRGGIKDFITADECKAIFSKIESMVKGGGYTHVSLSVKRSGITRWARSEMYVSANTLAINLYILRNIGGATGDITTNRLDNAGLLEAVRSAESNLKEDRERVETEIKDPFVEEPILKPRLWSDMTYSLTGAARTDMARNMIEPAETRGLFSAGSLEIGAEGRTVMNSNGLFRYYPITDVRCSVTVRNRQGTGSGWAAQHNYDLDRIDTAAIANRALDKCMKSGNPVAVEPGRYTVILEPQAVGDLFTPVLMSAPGQENIDFMRYRAESGKGPFASSRSGYSKINEQILDRRLTLSADPMDPEAGFVPFSSCGEPYKPVKWIDKGVLRELSYARGYALAKLGRATALLNSTSYRIGAETTGKESFVSVEDLIKSTERGLLVTRLSNVQTVNSDSVLCTGYTRDGLWLIEKGKITKPVKNFRFTESPLFALNNIEAIGVSERIFNPPYARVAPAIKIRDFSMTSLADSV